MVTTVTARTVSSITAAAVVATSTRTDQKSTRKSNRIKKNATSVSQSDFLWEI
jgi:hypothetical protein